MVPALADPFDARRARCAGSVDADFAPGLLSVFNAAGVLDPADIHVATLVARLAGETDERLLLAAALAVRAPRLGHVRTDLATIASTADSDTDEAVDVSTLPWPDPDTWLAALRASPIVGPSAALCLEGTCLYLDRYLARETQVAADLLSRASDGTTTPGRPIDFDALAGGLARLFEPTLEPDLQRVAAASAILHRISVIAGGPGTGKTTTVARVLALVHDQAAALGKRPPLIALGAPTGKAAARLEQAVHSQSQSIAIPPEVRARLLALRGSTIHRLLGTSPGARTRFRHDRLNRLPHDMVVIDETSMVSLSLMASLVEAVRPDARLVLVGDPQQLASVEAGAVLGDIVGPASDGLCVGPRARQMLESVARVTIPVSPVGTGGGIGDSIVVLRQIHRFGPEIGALTDAIKRGDSDKTVELLQAGSAPIVWIDADVSEPSSPRRLAPVKAAAMEAGRRVRQAAEDSDAKGALLALAAFRLLCAHRRGPAGASVWMDTVERWLSEDPEMHTPRGDPWYPGRPLLVTANDYSLGLFNGDTGVVVVSGDGRLVAAFEHQGDVAEVSPARLASVETVYAMTVHKAQGSQFDTIAVVLPPPGSPILTRELLYTAVSRARHRVILVGSEASVRRAVDRPIDRASGLRDRLWNFTLA